MNLKITTKNSHKEGHVVIRYSYSRKDRAVFSTGIVIPKADLQPTRLEKPVRSSNENAAHLNRQAAEVYHRICNIASQLFREGKEPTGSLVARHFHNLKDLNEAPLVDTMLAAAFQRFLLAENYYAETKKIYNLLYKDLVGCYGNRDMNGFAIEDWQELLQYLKGRRLSANTICIRLTKFKHFLTTLQKEGVQMTFSKLPMPKEEIKKISFNSESLQKIRAFQPSDESLRVAKEMCLFQCHTGLRISDLLRLEKDHLVQRGGLYQLSMESF
ncbi:MAG: hypothetical protein ACKOYP_06985, partial [Bacteroidota bacterium]